MSAEARRVARRIVPPVNALNFSVLLWPHFPFSMYGAANAATILELEQWQRTLKDQVSFNALGPMARKVLDTELVRFLVDRPKQPAHCTGATTALA
ncbi:MAG: hypothetical protein IPO87_06465 [Flavobacteriales bacterium]|nr:hypothetical protein [Flavobacteriales bacterium]